MKKSQKNKMVKENGLENLAILEERIRAIEGTNLYDPIKATEMCLVPNVVISKKFRVPEFIKYIGTQCPITHLKAYCNKMAEVIYDEKLLIYFFQNSFVDTRRRATAPAFFLFNKKGFFSIGGNKDFIGVAI